jgi:hypothetical protein
MAVGAVDDPHLGQLDAAFSFEMANAATSGSQSLSNDLAITAVI